MHSVDNQNNLFAVSNCIDSDLVSKFNNEPVDQYNYTKQEWQEDYPRRLLIPHKQSTLEQIQQDILSKYPDVTGVSFWYDLPGFTMATHIDNPAVEKVMQFYIGQANAEAGTTFYTVTDEDVEVRDDDQQWYLKNGHYNVRHHFDFLPNTGYIMYNTKTQAHGVPYVVTENDFRVSAYCYF